MLDSTLDLSQLASQLSNESEKNQLQSIAKLATLGEAGWQVLLDYLARHSPSVPNLVIGKIYQITKDFLLKMFFHFLPHQTVL